MCMPVLLEAMSASIGVGIPSGSEVPDMALGSQLSLRESRRLSSCPSPHNTITF